MSRLQFRLEATASGSRARAGRFRTLHSEVLTPTFMPVGTQATVKGQRFETLVDVGAQVLLANTYHLLLRPGPEVFQRVGGIHKFMNWKGSVLTDSGGFQIFSLPNHRKMTEEGAVFRSYVDGTLIQLTPERSIEMQKAIGSDIMMVLDECVPSVCDHATAQTAMELTHRWAARSLKARGDSPQSMFGIVQGACFPDLRRESARVLTDMDFDGFAIGGLAVGETKDEREEFTELAADLLPKNLPRYLMGVGTPIDLLEAVHRGVDMFDCILPTALAQQGVMFTSKGKIRLSRGVYKFSEDALDPDCPCTACTQYSRSYLSHLVKTKEVLGWQLLGEHNLTFYMRLMREMRQAILENRFEALYNEKRITLRLEDEENPSLIPVRKKRKAKVMQLGDFEVIVSETGIGSIRQKSSGETMHSVVEPSVEAERLYVEQSRLRERLSQENSEPLVLWDVGLGAATNAFAAILAFEDVKRAGDLRRPLRLISFECNLDSLRLALQRPELFPQARHPAAHAVARDGRWTSPCGQLEWTLLEGDFLNTMDGVAAPDLIFYDPFSYKTDGAMWQLPTFQKIFAACADRPTELFNYTASTAVRATCLRAGFYVAAGDGTGPKSETTRVLTPNAIEAYAHTGTSLPLLGAAWLDKWQRSDAQMPAALPEAERDSFRAAVRAHPQFARLEVS